MIQRLALIAMLAGVSSGLPSAVMAQGTPLTSAFGACLDQFANGMPPMPTFQMAPNRFFALCDHGHATLFSGNTHTPVFSAEVLTRERLLSASALKRVDSFHEDVRIPAELQPLLSDYVHSGYDRGHMAPNADMADSDSQHQSFELTNMVPQNPNNNRGLWADIEAVTRTLALQGNTVFVVTGPVFQAGGAHVGGIAVPAMLFKAVYVPAKNIAGVYLTKNEAGKTWQPVALDDIARIDHLIVFPSLPPALQAMSGSLPSPLDRHTSQASMEDASSPHSADASPMSRLMDQVSGSTTKEFFNRLQSSLMSHFR